MTREELLDYAAARMPVAERDLSALDLSNADLSGGQFAMCDFSGCNLTGAKLNEATFYQCRFDDASLAIASIDKGQKQELEAFVDAVKSGEAMPVSIDSLLATTAASIAVSRSVLTRAPENVSQWPSWIEAQDEDDSLPEAGAAQ